MRKTDALVCHCGEGSMEVEVLAFGHWRVERVLTACASCGSTDIEKARTKLAHHPPEDDSKK
jgi:hypothetical protein